VVGGPAAGTARLFEAARHAFGVIDGLKPESLNRLTTGITEVSLPAGEVMFRLGDGYEGFGFVVEGSAKVGLISELASELGTSRVIVSRILESFADEGLVRLGRRLVSVEDPGRLADRCG